MKVRIILDGAHSGGTFFLGSGRNTPDGYRYDTIKGREHLVACEMSVEELSKRAPDFLAHYGMPDTPVSLEFIPEQRDADAAAQGEFDALTDTIAQLRAKRDEQAQEIEQLRNALQAAKSAEPDPASRHRPITDDELGMLGERDAIMEVLKPIAGEMDTPLDVVTRLIQTSTGVPAEVLAESEPETTAHGVSNLPNIADRTGTLPEVWDAVGHQSQPDETARRAELEKLGKKKLAAIIAGIPGAETLTARDEQIEAILIHESARPPVAA